MKKDLKHHLGRRRILFATTTILWIACTLGAPLNSAEASHVKERGASISPTQQKKLVTDFKADRLPNKIGKFRRVSVKAAKYSMMESVHVRYKARKLVIDIFLYTFPVGNKSFPGLSRPKDGHSDPNFLRVWAYERDGLLKNNRFRDAANIRITKEFAPPKSKFRTAWYIWGKGKRRYGSWLSLTAYDAKLAKIRATYSLSRFAPVSFDMAYVMDRVQAALFNK